MFSKKSQIAFIGAGRIASSLISPLIKSGYNVKMIISRNKDSAKNLARKNSISNYSDDINDLSSKIQIIFLSVPDREIKNTAQKLSRLNFNFKNYLFIHLSGAVDISILNPLKRKGAYPASLHIMQTFPTKRIVKIKDSYAAVETEYKSIERFLFHMCNDLELNYLKLKSEDKSLYHLAGVFASNFLVGNIFSSEKTFNLKEYGGSVRNIAFLSPIIESTLKNILKNGSISALSGPVERGDLLTVKKHVAALKKLKDKNSKILLLNYLVQSLNLVNVSGYKYKSLNQGYLQIKEFLKKEIKKYSEALQ